MTRAAAPKLDRASWSALFDLIQELQEGQRISSAESGMLDDLCVSDDAGLLEAFAEHRRTKQDFFVLVAPLLRKARAPGGALRDNAPWSQGGGPAILFPSLAPPRKQAWGDAVARAEPSADVTPTRKFSAARRPELPEVQRDSTNEIQPVGAPPAAMLPRPVSSARRNPAELRGLTQFPMEPPATLAPAPAPTPPPTLPHVSKPAERTTTAESGESRANTRRNEEEAALPNSSAGAKTPAVPDRLATPPGMRQLVYAKKGFAEACWKCKGPIKPEWKRCPGCKAPPGAHQDSEVQGAAGGSVQSGAGAEAQSPAKTPAKTTEAAVKEFVMCPKCAAPCKAKWKECPSCKTPQKRVGK
eukprot:CAMPEP_0180225226 /NCGR_PEP_ID=MMETSP0987-20121128/22580_1 /TAXON_ID=697907 /ORGANISM="non described non described, Strain CCMP2293" /LENGTH=356 /DNA_ID=CAMNT_0022188265 /DNA_START=52 /DNA_END=1122 /DNA_ORIENTATION=+